MEFSTGTTPACNFLLLYAFKDVSEILAGFDLTFDAEKLVDCAFAVCAWFALEGYGFTFCFPAYDS